MCGQSLATCIIALIVLLVAMFSSVVVFRNIIVKFSLFIILMIALNAIANIANQILQEPRSEFQNLPMVIGQAVAIFFIFNYIPMCIFFTQR